MFRLQRTVEALTGMRLHKQNFRRLIAQGELLEATGTLDHPPRGRPAELSDSGVKSCVPGSTDL